MKLASNHVSTITAEQIMPLSQMPSAYIILNVVINNIVYLSHCLQSWLAQLRSVCFCFITAKFQQTYRPAAFCCAHPKLSNQVGSVLQWMCCPHSKFNFRIIKYCIKVITRSSAIAEGPCDASCQLKFANCHATVQKLLVRQVLNKSKLWS